MKLLNISIEMVDIEARERTAGRKRKVQKKKKKKIRKGGEFFKKLW